MVFCLFVDYSGSEIPPWDLVGLLPPGTVADLIAQGRALIEPEDDIVVVDLLEASTALEQPLDDLLAGAITFNDEGHQFYAEEIFKALGGARLDGAPLGEVHDYSFVP